MTILKSTFIVLACYAGALQAQDNLLTEKAAPLSVKYFDGLYFGLGAGFQNLFGGSSVNNMDVLAQQSKFVLDLYGGFRKQFLKNRLVVGLEGQLGFTDGDLSHKDNATQLEISYENNSQHGIGGTAGVTLGKEKSHLLLIYVNETTRNFDVTINQYGETYKQQDQQGMLKYGVGYETVLFKRLHLCARIGGLKVDFGDQVTNINVEDKLDYMLSALYQF
jgi:hypothetical protein